jgi:hypothetical protein
MSQVSHRITTGSEEHKQLFCRVFIDTHESYAPEGIPWPSIDEEGLVRLRSLPFWNEAVATEGNTAAKVTALGRAEPDPLLREAIELQGYEEARHSKLLAVMSERYRLPVVVAPPDPLPKDLTWGFVRTEYGECFDSFFAFGLFHLAEESGFFPRPLVAIFEPIVQEEARHVLFFANWIAYRRKQLPLLSQPIHWFRRGLALFLQAWRRLETARGIDTGDFAMKGHHAIDTSISPRAFLDVCLRENDRRLGRYDARLLRPALVPAMARLVRPFLR